MSNEGSSGRFEAAAGAERAWSIGKYRIVAPLATGGMSHVYLALLRGAMGFTKLVVLKMPTAEVAGDPLLLAMFLEEARIAARLNHQNVVQTYEVICEAGHNVMVMEYLDGHSLGDILARARKVDRALPLGLHLRIACEALNGLHHAHELRDWDGRPLGLVHRDVSPQNVLVTVDGHVKVLDFGVAKSSAASHVTTPGKFKGKVRYMPPEQFLGEGVDRRADVFAMGVMLWEAATGVRPWKNTSDVEVIAAVLAGRMPRIRDVNPGVEERLEEIVERALAFHREDRYASARELADDLAAYVDARWPRYAPNQLGAYIAELFADVRRERQRVVAERLARPATTPVELATFAAGALPPELVLPSSEITAPSSTRMIASRPSSASFVAAPPAAPSCPPAAFAMSVHPPAVGATTEAPVVTTPAPFRASPPPRTSRALLTTAIVVGLASAALTVPLLLDRMTASFAAFRSGGSPSRTAAAAPPPAPSALPTPLPPLAPVAADAGAMPLGSEDAGLSSNGQE